MSEAIGALLGGGIGSSLSELVNSLIQPVTAIVTLFVFIVTLPLIAEVLRTVTQTQATVSSLQAQGSSAYNYIAGVPATTTTPATATVTPGKYVYQPNPAGGGSYVWQTS